MKKHVFVRVVVVCVACAPAFATEPRDEAATLKKWAVAHCIATVYGEGKLGKDARAARWAYFEQSRMVTDVFEAMKSLVDVQLQQKARVLTDDAVQDVPLLNCMELYDSKALDEMIRAYMTQQIG